MRKYLGYISDFVPALRRRRLVNLLDEFSRRAKETDSPDAFYANVNALLSELLDFDRLAIRFVDSESSTYTDTYVVGHQVHLWGDSGTHTLTGSASGAVVETGEPLVLNDCSEPEVLDRFPDLRVNARRLPSLVCVPLLHEGRVAGTINLRSTKARAYPDRAVQTLEAIAKRLAPELVNSEQWSMSRREAHERTVLADIERLTGSTIDFGEVWDEFVAAVNGLIHFDRMVLAVIDEDGETIVDRFVYGLRIENWDENPERPRIKVPAHGVIRTMRAEVLTKEQNDAAHIDLMGYVMSEQTGLKSAMFAPIIAGDRAIGTISVRALEENAFSEADRLLFERIATRIGAAVVAAELYSRSVRLADEMHSRVGLEMENRKLEEMNRAKVWFISMVSHELRTPLTSIIAFTDLLGRNRDKNLSKRELAQIAAVKRNGSRLRLLIEDLLAMSEIEAGEIGVVRSQFSMQETIGQLADSIKPLLDAKGQRLVTEFSDPEINVTTDRSRVEQIVSNLVSNASKYSVQDDEIHVRVTLDGDNVKIAVVDHGDGIDEDDLATLFDEFSRLDNEVTKSNEGTGLGLAITRRLANALGGTIEVASERGKGSTFTVTLPVALKKAA